MASEVTEVEEVSSSPTTDSGRVPRSAPLTESESNAQPPRLMITKMVLENFKSYAGVREIGPFHKCFSSVVGPNGSGKSNVIDAMLFVFGKRAKKLRLNRVSELIHSSAAFQDLQYAKVSVHFCDILDNGSEDNYTVVEGSEMVVSRTAFKNNSSTYKLNGKNCSFKDVAAYLDRKGVDLDNNRFLILQGEVEMISMMPPKGSGGSDEGLLEYLEDIIGSNKFVEETELALQKVDSLTEQRMERLNRVKAVEAEKENLSGAKEEAEALLQKEREIRKKKNMLYQMNQSELQNELDSCEEKGTEMDKKLVENQQELEEATKKMQEFENGIAADNRDYSALVEDLRRAKKEFAAHERKQIKIAEDIKYHKETIRKTKKKIDGEEEKHVKQRNKLDSAKKSIPSLEKKIEDLAHQKETEETKLEKIQIEVREKTESIRPELEEYKAKLAPLERERSVKQSALDTAVMEVKLLEDSTTRAKEQLASAKKELRDLDKVQEEKRSSLQKNKDELLVIENTSMKKLETENTELSQKESHLSTHHAGLLNKCEEARSLLQAKNQTSGGASPTVRKILHARNSDLKQVDILGRLGDLATISGDYDVAVSTACNMLDYVVVRTTADAQRCLAFLRAKNLGRANFIPLDKMKKGVHGHNPQTPEGAPRLFDMITPLDCDVLPALYLGIKNTLVAPDLETATRWAYEYDKRWRVVTMDGKLIETSGTMSGGGRSVKKGGMKLSSKTKAKSDASSIAESAISEQDVEQLDSQATECQSLLVEVRSRRKEIADKLRKLNQRAKTLKVQLPKLKVEIEGCDTTREELTRRIPELEQQSTMSTEDKQNLKTLNRNVDVCKDDLAHIMAQAGKLEAEVNRLQKNILEAGGKRLKNQQKSLDKMKQKLASTKKELNEARITCKSSEKALSKAESSKFSLEKELDVSVSQLAALEETSAKLEAEIKEVHEVYEEAQRLEREKKVDLDKLYAENETLKKSLSKIKLVDVDLRAQQESNNKYKQDLEKKFKHWDIEIGKLHRAEEADGEYDVSDDEEEEEDEDKDKSEEEKDANDASSDVNMSQHEESEQPPSKKKKMHKTGLHTFSKEVLNKYRKDEIKSSIQQLEQEKDVMSRNANMAAIAEYRKKEADYLSRVGELDEITEQRNDARRVHEELRNKRLLMFMEGFGVITLKLKEMYQMITLGGDAELELVDSLDPFAEGIVFSVRPPKKSWKNIANLSGGEKTLSSLALVFALHHYKPTPLYVMDEIDAALDFKNVSIVANYIKERTKNAQFIIISLRNNMFELADRLVGIYKTNNCTKSVTISPRHFGKARQNKTPTKIPLADRTNSA